MVSNPDKVEVNKHLSIKKTPVQNTNTDFLLHVVFRISKKAAQADTQTLIAPKKLQTHTVRAPSQGLTKHWEQRSTFCVSEEQRLVRKILCWVRAGSGSNLRHLPPVPCTGGFVGRKNHVSGAGILQSVSNHHHEPGFSSLFSLH